MKSFFLNPEAAKMFGSKKQTKAGKFTIKYVSTKDGIVFTIYNGAGAGSQIASTPNWAEALHFTKVESEYKSVISAEGKKGGAWFYKGTDVMIFTNHPFYGTKFKVVK